MAVPSTSGNTKRPMTADERVQAARAMGKAKLAEPPGKSVRDTVETIRARFLARQVRP